MLKHIILSLSIIVLLTSCSSRLTNFFKSDSETVKRNDQLMKSFDVDDNVLEKFAQKEKVQPVSKPEAIVTKDKTTPPVKKKKVQKKTTKKKIKKIAKKKTKNKKRKKKIFEYPDGYPEQFKPVDILTEKYWDEFKPIVFPGEKVVLEINYMGLTTGKIAITTKPMSKIGDIDVFHFNARVKTSRYYSYLYELDDNIDTYLSVDKFSPIKYSLIQRESGQNIDDLQLFDHAELKSYTFYKRETKKKTKKSKGIKFIPRRFQDPLSIIYFIRGLPMEKGRHFEIPIINKGKLIILKAKMAGTEKIKTKLGVKEAYIVKASTTYSGATLKSGNMTFWFTKDERRIFLKFKAKIKIGAISGDIVKYSR